MVRSSKVKSAVGASKQVAEESKGIVVTAQQSRFHVDANETPESREVDVKNVGLAINGRDLLVGADLRLKEGVHYVLVGRNGTGKSTLLRALGEGRVPGIASNLRILLLGQTHNEDEDEEIEGFSLHNETALQHVIRSDKKRERALRDAESLSKALNSEDPSAAVAAVRKVRHSRLEAALKRARLLAARRSGARGWDARAELNDAEQRLALSQELLQQDFNSVEASTIEEDTKEAVRLLDEIQSSLQVTNWATADIRARNILQGLRFSHEQMSNPFGSLSGGWRMRCELASALFQRSDILLLDEPTNYLDLTTVIWLQQYLKELNQTIVVVTHDRDFANEIAEELIVLREQKLETFDGTLSEYEAERAKQTRRLSRMQETQDKKIEHMERTIQQNKVAAKRTGDDKKLKQAASRQKKLDERMGVEVSAKGGRFKLNRDLVGYHLTSRAAIDIPQDDPAVRMSFPDDPPDLRFPGALVNLENVSFEYPKSKEMVLKDINMAIHIGDRVGLAGLNGSGKSTLVKLAVSNQGERDGLKPLAGSVTQHPRLRCGYFSQQSTEELEELGRTDKSKTALSHILSHAGEDLSESKARALLGSMGLQGRIASDVPIASLSGGQKVRLALAKHVWTPPHLLVLDEVTTHLDADTIVALIEALRGYKGALLVVTHDRYFMRCVVEGAKTVDDDSDSEGEDEEGDDGRRRILYRIVKGRLEKLEGGMRQYEEIASRRLNKLSGG